MDLVFVAEQYAQAQAAAMAQYYANAAALGAQPGAPPGGMVVTNAATGLGPLPPPIVGGSGPLGSRPEQPASTTSGSMPQPPPPPSIESRRYVLTFFIL